MATEAAFTRKLEWEKGLGDRYDKALGRFLDERTVARLTGALQLVHLANVGDPSTQELAREVASAFGVYLRQPIPATADDASMQLRSLILREFLQISAEMKLDNEGVRDLHGVDLRGLTLEDLDLSDVDFRGADLSRAVFRGCQFRNTRLVGAKLTRTRFELAREFRAVDLSGVQGQHTIFRAMVMDRPIFHGAILAYPDFDGSTMLNAIFTEAKLLEPVFRCSINGGVFSSATIVRPKLGLGPYEDLRGFGVEVPPSDVETLEQWVSDQLTLYPRDIDEKQWNFSPM